MFYQLIGLVVIYFVSSQRCQKFDFIYLFEKQLINFFKLRDKLKIHEIDCMYYTG